VLVPLEVVSLNTLKLPPGCVPPPAAFFLVEQQLRGGPTAAAMDMAFKLLAQSMEMFISVTEKRQQQQQQQEEQQQQESRQEDKVCPAAVEDQQAAATDLQRLAYCSLASSVVQACQRKPELGEVAADTLLQFAAVLVQAPSGDMEAGNTNTCSSGGSGNSSAGSGDNSSNKAKGWSLAMRLGAAMAAGAYTAHLQPATSTGCDAAPGSSGSCSQGTAGDAGCVAGASNAPSGCTCKGGGDLCCVASQLFIGLRQWEQGAAMYFPSGPTARASLQKAAQRHNTTLQQYLQQQLLALAWQHPVPYVCSNVLCAQLKGPSAVGAVRGLAGTLCGGCRAAWYCCEGCQQEAWQGHIEVCRRGRCS
jgi:hypothetical protein